MIPSRRWFATTIGAGGALGSVSERGGRGSETAHGYCASEEEAGAAADCARDRRAHARIEGVVQAVAV
jgi:hypothetical protein